MDRKTLATCPQCGGRGQVYTGARAKMKVEKCPLCKGVGRVPPGTGEEDAPRSSENSSPPIKP